MHQDATWYGGRPQPRRHCIIDGVPAPRQRGTAAPIFSSHVSCGQGRPSQLVLSSCKCLYLCLWGSELSVNICWHQLVFSAILHLPKSKHVSWLNTPLGGYLSCLRYSTHHEHLHTGFDISSFTRSKDIMGGDPRFENLSQLAALGTLILNMA